MQVVLISGSRNPDGQTAQAAKAFLTGCAIAGSETTEIFLPQLQIGGCLQCQNNGWGICSREGRCCQSDDFASVVKQIQTANAVVFATPVYWGDLSESLRAFLDRLRRICMVSATKETLIGKPAVGICMAGGGGGGAPSCVVSLEKVLHIIGFQVLDLIPARRQNLDLKCKVLQTTGEWFVHQVESLQQQAG